MGKFQKIWKKSDKLLILLPFLFAALSIVIIVSISYKNGVFLRRDTAIQAAAYALGFAAMFFLLLTDYRRFESKTPALYAGSLLFLLSVYLPGLGVTSFGARSWINLGVTTFQPSEIVKITFTLCMASYLVQNKDSLRTFSGVIKSALYAAPFILIVIKEDLGSGTVFCFIWLFMVFFAGIGYGIFLRFAGVFLCALPAVYYFMAPYQKQRIDAFLHPDELSLPGNYHVWNSKVAIGSGGFQGKGLFQGTQKELDFLPVQKSDFVFSVIVEELGFIGGAAVILLFACLFYRMARTVYNARDLYGALIVIGLLGMFLFQVFENIAMTMGIMPVTGVTLPFISYGGSSVLSNMTAVGLVLSVDLDSKSKGNY